MRFHPREGPSRGFLRDCETDCETDGSSAAQVTTSPARSCVSAAVCCRVAAAGAGDKYQMLPNYTPLSSVPATPPLSDTRHIQ